jgi:ribosomal protein L11 methyltransferase (prmA)
MGVFRFKEFNVDDSGCGMKICSDSVLLAAWFLAPHSGVRAIADIGAGSGVLALLAAQICPEAIVTAVELDHTAAAAAAANFTQSPFAGRLTVVEADFTTWHPDESYDLIISNPPYFTNGELSADRSRSAARHQQGLTYESLLRRSASLLSQGGHLGMVSPAEFENDIIFQAEMAGMKLRRLMRVKTSPTKGVTRLLWDFSRTDGTQSTDELSIRQSDGSYTTSYRNLVEQYYMKL